MGALRRTLIRGSGVDIQRIGVFNFDELSFVGKLLEGDLMGGTSEFFTNMVSMDRQRGVPWFGAETFAVANSLKELNEIMDDEVPILNILQTKKEQMEADLAGLKRDYYSNITKVNLEGTEQATREMEKITKLEQRIQETEAKKAYKTAEKFADFTAQKFPLTAWLAKGFHPFQIASMLADATAQDMFYNQALNRVGKPEYTGTFSTLSQFFGITGVYNNRGEMVEAILNSIYEPLTSEAMPDWARITPEHAELLKNTARLLDDSLMRADVLLNNYMKEEHIPGGSLLEDMKKRILPKERTSIDLKRPDRPKPDEVEQLMGAYKP